MQNRAFDHVRLSNFPLQEIILETITYNEWTTGHVATYNYAVFGMKNTRILRQVLVRSYVHYYSALTTKLIRTLVNISATSHAVEHSLYSWLYCRTSIFSAGAFSISPDTHTLSLATVKFTTKCGGDDVTWHLFRDPHTKGTALLGWLRGQDIRLRSACSIN